MALRYLRRWRAAPRSMPTGDNGPTVSLGFLSTHRIRRLPSGLIPLLSRRLSFQDKRCSAAVGATRREVASVDQASSGLIGLSGRTLSSVHLSIGKILTFNSVGRTL